MYKTRGRYPIQSEEVKQLIQECLEIFKRENIELRPIDGWVNVKAKTILGTCESKITQLPDGSKKESCRISINLFKLTDKTEIKTTILHELCHAAKDSGFGHGPEWKAIAKKISLATGLEIKRTLDLRDSCIERRFKYMIYCKECDFKTYRSKRSRITENIHRCSCPKCKGRLGITKL